MFVLCHSFGLGKANISGSLTRHVRQRRGGEAAHVAAAFTNEATSTACKFPLIQVDYSAISGTMTFFVTYADSLYAWDVILAAAPTCGQNEKRSRRDSFRDWSAGALTVSGPQGDANLSVKIRVFFLPPFFFFFLSVYLSRRSRRPLIGTTHIIGFGKGGRGGRWVWSSWLA